MKFTTRYAFIATVLLLMFAAGRAAAQPCGAFTITFGNNTSCKVDICISTNLGNVCSGVLAPGGSVVTPLVAPVTLLGAISAGGITYPFVASPIPGFQWAPNIALPPSGCCCDVIYDPNTCTVKAVPTSAPPPCQP
jgi:hypothetical protein